MSCINFLIGDGQIKLMSQHPDYGTVEDVSCDLDVKIWIYPSMENLSRHPETLPEQRSHLEIERKQPDARSDKDDDSCVFVVTP